MAPLHCACSTSRVGFDQAAASVSRHTRKARARASARRHLDDAAVQQQVRDARAALFEQALGALAGGLTDAVATLVRNLDAEQSGVQVRAAVALLDQAIKARESEELAQRVADLEAALKDAAADPPADLANHRRRRARR